MPDQLGNAGVVARKSRTSQSLFMRPLPGGGSVRVELLVSDRGDVGSERLCGRVVMDDESLTHFVGARVVIVEEIEGRDADEVVPELLRIARDNAAIARRVLRHRVASTRAD